MVKGSSESACAAPPTGELRAEPLETGARKRLLFTTIADRAVHRFDEGQGSPDATMFLRFVLKMRQALTFSATIENDDDSVKTLAAISILALLTVSGAAYTDQLLTSDQQTMQSAN